MRWYHLILNKYFITFTAFVVWMVFFDNNNLIYHRQLRAEFAELEKTKQYYQQEISRNNMLIRELTTNKETLEKFAREKYLMKRDSDDVFVVVRE